MPRWSAERRAAPSHSLPRLRGRVRVGAAAAPASISDRVARPWMDAPSGAPPPFVFLGGLAQWLGMTRAQSRRENEIAIPPAQARSAWWGGVRGGGHFSSAPTPAHFTNVKFVDPPHRFAGGGDSAPLSRGIRRSGVRAQAQAQARSRLCVVERTTGSSPAVTMRLPRDTSRLRRRIISFYVILHIRNRQRPLRQQAIRTG